MNSLEAIQTVQQVAPADLNAEQLAALEEFFAQNPAVARAVGGPQLVAQYLEEARAASNFDERHAADEAIRAALLALAQAQRRRRRLALGLAVLLLVALAGIFPYDRWFDTHVPIDRAPEEVAQETPPTDDEPAAEQDQEQEHQEQEQQEQQQGQGQQQPRQADPAAADSGSGSRTADHLASLKPRRQWHGWWINAAENVSITTRHEWDNTDPLGPRAETYLVSRGGQLMLKRQQRVDPQRPWLRLRLGELEPGEPVGQLEVRVDGRPFARFSPASDSLNAISLKSVAGRIVNVEVIHHPAEAREQIVWKSVDFSPHKTGVAWAILAPKRVEASGGAKLSIEPDGAIIASGPNATGEEYAVTARIPAGMDVQAVRLEALNDATLPDGGPGRGPAGAFALGRFSASLTEQDERREALLGRYVRVELPGNHRPLHLAEVQVFSGEANVALGKPAMQESVAHRGHAERAVDGNTDGYHHYLQSTSVTQNAPSPPGAWWEVDLEREYPIDRVVVWNAVGEPGEQMTGHRLVVLDMFRNVVWQHNHLGVPRPNVIYGPFLKNHFPLEFRTARLRAASLSAELPQVVDPVAVAAGSFMPIDRPSNFIFPLQRTADPQGRFRLGGRLVTFRIQHHGGSAADPSGAAQAGEPLNLGRFRLSVSADEPPSTPEPPLRVIVLLPGVGGESPSAEEPPMISPAQTEQPATLPHDERDEQNAQEVVSRPPNMVPAGYQWLGWDVDANPDGFASPKHRWYPGYPRRPTPETSFTTGRRLAALGQNREITPGTAWLQMRAGQTHPSQPAGHVEVRVDAIPIARFDLIPMAESPDRLISLEKYIGQTVRLELVHIPAQEEELVDWDEPAFVADPAAAGWVPWTPLAPLDAVSRLDTELTVLPDHSVLASGPNPWADEYVVTVQMPDAAVTAVRLEALPHASLPLGGPGRQMRGSFAMGRFAAELVDSDQASETHLGRFVRLELPGENRSLMLSELQVFADGENVALHKPAKISSIMFNGSAELAVDGLIGNGNHPSGKGVGFAHTANTPESPWWEVDLGEELPIEAIGVWNRIWSGNEMANYKIQILGAARNVVWEHTNPHFPIPCDWYRFPHRRRAVAFANVDVTHQEPHPSLNAQRLIQQHSESAASVWKVIDRPGRGQVLVVTVEPGQNLSGKQVRFRLGHFCPRPGFNLGRFRLSATAAEDPGPARRPSVIVDAL